MGRWEQKQKDLDNGLAYIQVLSGGGGWFTVSQCLKSDEGVVELQLSQAKDRFPDRSIRAIDQKGGIIDIA